MKIQSVKLTKYKMLLGGGINQLTIDVVSNVVCIIGQNGSGKSSTLREISVYPSTSSDYEVGGGKEVVVTHEGSTYLLTSTFEKARGIHSFKKDEEELNVSGNSRTQIDLCEKHFNINAIIRDIVSGNVSMTSLSATERKSLLMARYPSDLTFVLKHHKNICSRIRTSKALIKRMQIRKSELSDTLMDEEEYQRLTKVIVKLSGIKLEVDKWVHTYTEEIAMWQQSELFTTMRGKNTNLDVETLNAEAIQLKYKHADRMRKYPKLSSEEISTLKSNAKLTLDNTSLRMQEMLKAITDITKEIDEFEALADRNIGKEITDLEHISSNLDIAIAACGIDPLIPVVNKEHLTRFNIEELQGLTFTLNSVNTPIISSKALDDIRGEIRTHQLELTIVSSELGRTSEILKQCEKRKYKEGLLRYNSSCTLPCQLKDNLDNNVADRDREIEDATKVVDDLITKKEQLQDLIVAQQRYVLPLVEVEQQVIRIEQFVENCPYISYILQGKDLYEVLTHNTLTIHNRIVRLLDNAKLVHEKATLEEQKENVLYKLNLIKTSELPTKELISKTLIDRKVKLNRMTDAYAELKSEVVDLTAWSNICIEHADSVTYVDQLCEDTVAKANYNAVAGRIKLLQTMVSNLEEYRASADAKQADIQKVVRDQGNLRVRLKEEIEPELNKLHTELKDLETVESALSPSTGFPHVYMVRFINSLISTVNTYLKRVWSYDMVLSHLKESSPLDYLFPISVKTYGKVQDIGRCSTGEKEVLDLMWTFALCQNTNLGSIYPIKTDECDSGLSHGHRQNLLTLLSTLVRQNDIGQMFIVNHHSSLYTAFADSQVICLNPDGIIPPANYNEHVTIA